MARPVHFEIHADDPQRAIAFYTDVFGWTVNQWGDQPYWLVSTGPTDEPGIDGAILPRMGDRPLTGAPAAGRSPIRGRIAPSMPGSSFGPVDTSQYC